MVRRILSFSAYVLLLSAGARLGFETDALVIGAIFGVAAIPFYTVANSLVIYLMEIVVAIAAVVSPMATKLNTEGRTDELREMFLKWSKIALSLSMIAGVVPDRVRAAVHRLVDRSVLSRSRPGACCRS